MSKYKKLSPEFVSIALLILSVLIFFSKVILSGKPLFGSDFVLQFYPWKKFIYDYVQSHGSLPLWNPYQFAGTPFIANIQASMFYPLGLLFYLMPPEQAYGYTIVLHCTLGAIFMYAFARSLTINKAGAFLAAIVFTFNGFFIAHLYAGHLTFVQNYIWIPLIFFYLHKFLKFLHLRHAMLAGLFLGIQILGGFPQIAFYTIVALSLYGGYHIGIRLKRRERSSIFRLSGGIVIIVLFGFALAAVQLLPTYEFTQLSTRSGGVTYEFATSDSFAPVNLITFLIPNFFGNPANGSYWKSPEYWQFWEFCAYAGIGPLLLLGFLKNEGQTRRVRTFFVLLLLLSLFLSFGRHNPLYRFIYHLPGFSHFRIPAQILYLYIFSLSILSGVALNSVSRLESYSTTYKIMAAVGLLFFGVLILALALRPVHFFYYVFKIIGPSGLTPDLIPRLHEVVRLSLFTGAGFFILVTALLHLRCTHRLGSTSLIVAFLLVTTVDLWSFSNRLVRTTDLSLSEKKIDLSKSLNTDQEISRVVTMGTVFGPNEGLLYGYEDIQGYDPLILKRYLEYINKSQDMPISSEAVNVQYVTRLDNHLIRMLNVKYSISDTGALKLKDHVPRAFIVHKAITVPAEKVLAFMMSDDFNPAEMVVLEGGRQSKKFLRHNAGPQGGNGGHKADDKLSKAGFECCRITDYGNKEIELTVKMNKAGYLVMSEINYPGWEAYIDGIKTDVLTGNYVFRVVRVPKGTHKITMKFHPRSFTIGLIVSAATALFFVLSQSWLLIRKKT